MQDLFAYAQRYVTLGKLSVHPLLRKDQPIGSWIPRQNNRPTIDELLEAFANGSGAVGIAIICGNVSEGLEVYDFDHDAENIYPAWKQKIIDAGYGDQLAQLPVVKTPGEGFHTFTRSEECGNNSIYATRDRKRLIETRANGGYVVAVGSLPSVHPAGIAYELISGDLLNIPVISKDFRDVLISVSKSFNEESEPELEAPKENQSTKNSNSLRPGDDYNIKAQWPEILGSVGWKYAGKTKDGKTGQMHDRWKRPGGKHSSHGDILVNETGKELFYCWTSDAPPLEHGKVYDKFGFFATMHHHGDLKAAAYDLGGKGYGTPAQPAAIPNLSDIKIESLIEFASEFLSGDDIPLQYIIPEIIPLGALILVHGDPRAMKSLATDEIIVAAATGTPAFGLARFMPQRKFKVWRCAAEDPKSEERVRIRGLLSARNIEPPNDTLAFSIHKGIDLDDPNWQQRMIDEIKKHNFELVIIDPMRGFSEHADKGPAEKRELMQYFRRIIVETGCSVIIIHHDVKPPQQNQDIRKRGHRASGGGWFAACECPIHIEKIDHDRSLFVCEGYKFSSDPAPFTFQFKKTTTGEITLTGKEESETDVPFLELENKIEEYLQKHPNATKSNIRTAVRRNLEDIEAVLERMIRAGKADSVPGAKKGWICYFLTGPIESQNDTENGIENEQNF